MRIGGFVKQSFIDWEGKITAVIFTKGCNFRCGFCHNPSLVLPKLIEQTPDIELDTIIDYLKTRKQWLDGVVITGGEPTLHNDLSILIATIKELGYLVKLDTNGTNPSLLKSLITSNSVDFVAMDIKTILEQDEYSKICNYHNPNLINLVKDSIEILKSSEIDYQLRTTVIPKYHSDRTIVTLKKEFSYCNYKLQPFRDGDTVEKMEKE